MASIKGLQLKNVKRTLGMEGYGVICTMYLNGKKIGAYEDYGDGSCENITYVDNNARKNLVKVIIEYAKTHKNDFVINMYNERPQQYKEECERFKKYNPFIADEDITIQTMASNSIVYIFDDLMNLMEIEKQFKKYIKKGYECISINGNKICAYPHNYLTNEIIEEKKLDGSTFYRSLSDFDIL